MAYSVLGDGDRIVNKNSLLPLTHGLERTVPAPIHTLKSYLPVPQSMAIFGSRVFKEVIQLRGYHPGPDSRMMTVS